MPNLSELLTSWQDLRHTFDPVLATRAGAEGYDGRLPGLDAESVKLQLAGLKSLAGAVELADLADDDEEIDRTALLDVLRARTYQLEQEVPQRRNPAAWLGALANAYQALRAHPHGEPHLRAQAALERLEGTEEFIEKATKVLKTPAAVFVAEAVELAPAARSAARLLAGEAPNWLPGLSERLASATRQAELAIAAFEHRLREDVSPSAEPTAYAVGREAFDHRLHFEHALRPSSPELWRWSQHTLEESRHNAVAAGVAAGLGDDLHQAVKKLRAARPAADLQAEVLRSLARARKWVEGKGLLQLPPAELRLLEMPDHLQLLGGRVMFEAEDVVYLRPQSTVGALSSPEVLVDVLLELCPGRLTHRSIARGLADPVRRVLATPCATDGWALYGLDVALAEGLVEGPFEVLAVRLAQLHAIARAVIDIGLHTEGFTPDAAADLLTQLLPLERVEAVADVRRAAAWPTYSLAAAVGRREILELKEAWTASRRGGETARFHAELLEYGGLPISLARWGMDLGLEE
ncbi:MAG TPA: DUF885 family protein [Gemmatimonadales bacterium]|nr:DUF885 family protein [Gemmatimonadales bacterium]